MASQALLFVVLLACAVGCFCVNYGNNREYCWPISIRDRKVHRSMEDAARRNGQILYDKFSATICGPYGMNNRYTDYYVRYSTRSGKVCENVVVWDAMSFTGGIINIYGRGCFYP